MAFIRTSFQGEYDFAVIQRVEDGVAPYYVYPGGQLVGEDLARGGVRDLTFSLAGHTPVSVGKATRANDLFVEIEPAGGNRWTGIFEANANTDWGAHGVLALPDRISLAVCCHGEAYRVRADDPSDWEELHTHGMSRAPVVLEEHELVLFIDFTGILAWGPTGEAWDTGGIVDDELAPVAVRDGLLVVEGAWPPGTTRTLHVDLADGTSTMLPLES